MEGSSRNKSLSNIQSIPESGNISTNSDEPSSTRRGKKRLSRKEEWLSNKAKRARNLGQAYISRGKEKTAIPARSMLPPCNGCKYKCTRNINDEDREYIFNSYWKLGDITSQRNFIHKCIEPNTPTNRISEKEKPRRVNQVFYFIISGENIRVCKNFFKATLAINDRVIRTVIQKTEEDGFLKQDLRGKHKHHNTIDDSIKQGVKDHIKSIPRIESHYIRKNTSREFIDGGQTLSDLYKDYKKHCERTKQPYAHMTMYSRLFNSEFNIGFFKPKKRAL